MTSTRQKQIDEDANLLDELRRAQKSSRWFDVFTSFARREGYYKLKFFVPGYTFRPGKDLKPTRDCEVRIQLPQDYPSSHPIILFVPPIPWHPLISLDGRPRIALPASASIIELTKSLWDIVTYEPLPRLEPNEYPNPDARNEFNWIRDEIIVQKPIFTIPESLASQKKNLGAGIDNTISDQDSSTRVVGGNSSFQESTGHAQLNEHHDAQRATSQSPQSRRPASPPQNSTGSLGFRTTARRKFQPMERSIPDAFRAFLGKPDLVYGNSSRVSYQFSHTGSWQSRSLLHVYIHINVMDAIWRHAQENTYRERFGILLGSAYVDEASNTTWLEIIEMLPGVPQSSSATYVEVNAAEIARLGEEAERRAEETGKPIRKIGWYHTHPGHGIFMSETDLTTQRNQYTAPWQIAMVVDPRQRLYGIFSGHDAQAVDERNVALLSEESIRQVSHEANALTAMPSTAAPPPKRRRQQVAPIPVSQPKQQAVKLPWGRITEAGLLLVLGILFGFLIGRASAPTTTQATPTRAIASANASVTATAGAMQTRLEAFQQTLLSYAIQHELPDETYLLAIVISIDPETAAGRQAADLLGSNMVTTSPLVPTSVATVISAEAGDTATTAIPIATLATVDSPEAETPVGAETTPTFNGQ